MAKAGLVAAGDQPGARGRAKRRDIALSESIAAGRDGVDIGRGNTRAAVATEFTISQIIRINEQDVGLLRSRP